MSGEQFHHVLPTWCYPVGLLLVLVLARVVSKWRWPWAHCLCCRGAGRHYRADRKVWDDCRWCRGGGKRSRGKLR